LDAADRIGWRGVSAALGLALAGVSAPIAVAAIAATSGLLGPPLVASALVGLLVLAPAGVGLATALSGLRRIAAGLAAQGSGEAEQAVLRIFVTTLVFGYSLGLAAAPVISGQPGADLPGLLPATYLPVAAFGLVAAWAVLLHVILWPAAAPVRRYGAMALDLAVISAFLHFGGGEAGTRSICWSPSTPVCVSAWALFWGPQSAASWVSPGLSSRPMSGGSSRCSARGCFWRLPCCPRC
jgi:hypothetical protein